MIYLHLNVLKVSYFWYNFFHFVVGMWRHCVFVVSQCEDSSGRSWPILFNSSICPPNLFYFSFEYYIWRVIHGGKWRLARTSYGCGWDGWRWGHLLGLESQTLMPSFFLPLSMRYSCFIVVLYGSDTCITVECDGVLCVWGVQVQDDNARSCIMDLLTLSLI